MYITRGIAAVCAATLTFVAVPAGAAERPAPPTATRATLEGELLLASGNLGSEGEALAVSVRTEDGSIVALDPRALPDELGTAASGAEVEVVVQVPAAAQDDLVEVAPDALTDGSATRDVAEALSGLGEVRALDAVVVDGEAIEVGESLVPSDAAGDTAAGSAAGLAAKKTHAAYVVLVDDKRATGEVTAAAAKEAIGRGASYWKRETGGRMAGMAVKQTVTHTTRDVCSAVSTTAGMEQLWADVSAKYFPKLQFTATNARHLVVMLPAGCQGLGIQWTGFARIHSDLASGGQMMFVYDDTLTMAHEMGHNFGLGHSNLVLDGAPLEYHGVHSVQGFTWARPDGGFFDPPALDAAYADALSVAAAASTTRGTPGGTTKLAPVTATSGQRALAFTDTEGTLYYVEYRAGTGRDASTLYALPNAFEWVEADPTAGVRVYAVKYWAGLDVETLGTFSGGRWHSTLKPGMSVKTLDGKRTVTVPAIGGGTASVKVSGTRSTSTTVAAVRATHGKKSQVTVTVKGASPMGGVVSAKVGATNLGSAELRADGTARFTLPANLRAGRHAVTATFAGTATTAASKGSRAVTVAKAKPRVKLLKAKNLKRGKKATLTVRVSGTSTTAASGKIKVKVGSKTVSKAVKLKKRKGSWTATVRTTRLPKGVVRVVYAPSGAAKTNLVKGSYSTGKRLR